jgi:hypothetical protein
MKQRFGVFATLVFAGTFVSPESVQGQPDVGSASGLTLTVEVDNFANVSPTTLRRGQAITGQILAEAGIILRWVDCPCEKPRPDATTLSLRIIPKLFGSTMSTFRSDHLGFAAATEEGGVLATVFYDRIRAVGKGGELSSLLGLAMAHELGHLLLGLRAHTDEGIMRPYWTREHLRQAHPNQFRFNLEQSQTIRVRVSRYQAAVNASR